MLCILCHTTFCAALVPNFQTRTNGYHCCKYGPWLLYWLEWWITSCVYVDQHLQPLLKSVVYKFLFVAHSLLLRCVSTLNTVTCGYPEEDSHNVSCRILFSTVIFMKASLKSRLQNGTSAGCIYHTRTRN